MTHYRIALNFEDGVTRFVDCGATEKVLDAAKARILGIDTSKGSGWTVVDAFDVMVHLFTPENRTKYRLDTLWGDATEVSLTSLLKK